MWTVVVLMFFEREAIPLLKLLHKALYRTWPFLFISRSSLGHRSIAAPEEAYEFILTGPYTGPLVHHCKIGFPAGLTR